MAEPIVQPALPLGVNLVGYLDRTLGVGAAARNVATALRAAGVTVAPLVLASDAPLEEGADSDSEEPVHPVTIVCANPEGMAGARDQAPAAFDDRYVIGMWWWEVDVLPQRWMRAFDLVDEVWTGSRFVADALAALSPVPVVHVPLPVPTPVAAPAGRTELGLPDDTFLFGFVYDYRSVAARKNPVGVVEAFRRAFDASLSEDVGLVLKTLDADGAADHAEVVAAAEGDARITFRDGNIPVDEKNALIRELDCYVSLHRSEGFGLTIAEAMVLGTPVIATDYGGSRDFATPFNALLVDHRVTPIGPGNDPYPADGVWAEPDIGHAAALMREAFDDAEALHERATRGRSDVPARHAPAAAGRVMADRLGRILSLPPRDGAGRPQELDLEGIRARMGREPEAGDGVREGPRATLRDAALRAMRPYTAHQRLVDEEIVLALQTLDERLRGLASGQQALAAELARLRREVEEE